MFYFQVGLIVFLLVAYVLLEMKFETSVPNYSDIPHRGDPISIDIPAIRTLALVFDEPVKQKKNNLDVYEEVPDKTADSLIAKEPTEPAIETPPLGSDYNAPPLLDKPEDINVPFIMIQDAPIYPSCEKAKTNSDRKKCMSDKITKLIQRKFEGSDIASDYGLTGKQKIDVQFKIDKTGHVTDIKTRAPHPKLEDEAKGN